MEGLSKVPIKTPLEALIKIESLDFILNLNINNGDIDSEKFKPC